MEFHSINHKAEALHRKFVDLHADFTNFLAETHPDIAKASLAMGHYADQGLLCREMEEFADELRKEAKARKELVGKLIAAKAAQETLGGNPVTCVKGTLGMALPETKLQGRPPERDTAEYFQFLRHLGVPEKLLQDGMPLKVDWKGLTEYLSERAEKGEPVPPGITKTYPLFMSTFRRTSGKKRKSAESKSDESTSNGDE